MIHRSPTVLEYPQDATLTDIFLHTNPNNTPPDKPAIIDGLTGETVFTYESLRVAAEKFARYLQSVVGVKPGTVVAILSTTKLYFPVAVHGVLAVGAVVSAFNPLYQPKEIAHALRLAKPTHIIVEDTLLPALQNGLFLAALRTTPTTHIWSDSPSYTAPAPHHTLSIHHILATTPPTYHRPHQPPKTSLAFIAFSSGTSGPVKGVALTHAAIVANIHQQRAALAPMFASPATVTVLAVPFFHILGLAGFCCQYASAGLPIVVFGRFDAAALLAAVERDRITHVNVVPPIALALLNAPRAETERRDLGCLRCLANAAAPLKQPLADALAARYGVAVTQWYGMTEAAPSLASQREDEVGIAHTVGRLLPGVEAMVRGEGGGECGVGVPGELLVRGPNLMVGYVREDGGEDGARDGDGWFRTGDIGFFDEKGYLFLVDRAKEMIKVKGHQVAPAELETILLGHPKVADAAVCGVYVDAEASEFPVAYVALHAAEKVRGVKEMVDLRQDIRKHVDGQVAHYKRLKGGVHVLDAIPRNPSGKVLRRLLPASLAKAADINKTRVSKL